MNIAAQPDHEAERLGLLAVSKLLDAEPLPALDALVRLAATQTGFAVALINLIDAHRVYSLARHGTTRKHYSRARSPCERVMELGSPLVLDHLPDNPAYAAFAQDAPAAPWRSYVGLPIMVQGQALGTLCVLDQQVRETSAAALTGLQDLAQVAASIIAAQVVAQRARKQEARIRTASLSGSDWLWETDDQGCIQWVSASLLQHTGLDPIAEIGLRSRDIYHPRDDHTRASWDRYIRARDRREPFSDAIAERETPRGRIAVSISGTPVFNRHGRFMGYRGSSRNVTRQLELETKTRQQDALLRQAVETFQAGVMISDPQGRIVQANRHWRERQGITDLASAPSWPDLVRQSIKEGMYLDAAGREDDFFQWRMGIVNQGESVPVRTRDALAMVRDHRLPDGSIVHFSTDVSPSHLDAVTLQEVLQADLSLGLLVIDARDELFPVIYGNPGVAHMSGLHKDDLTGQAAMAVFTQLGADQIALARLHAGLAQGQSCVVVLGRSDETAGRSYELRMTPLGGRQGHIDYVMVLLHDVTDRQAATDKLRVSEELYRGVAATISDGLLVVGLDGKVVAMNPAGHRILGLSKEMAQDLHGRHLALNLLTDDLSEPLPESEAPWLITAQTGQRLRNQVYPLRTPGHALVWIQLSCHQLSVSTDSTPFAVVATFRDITQERAAAQALARSEERWKFALEGAGDAVWDWSVGQGIMFYSSRWYAMLGYEEADASVEPVRWTERIHEDDRERVMRAFDDYCHEGQGIFQAEFRIRHRKEHYIWILARGKVVRQDMDGRPVRVVGTTSDITLLKAAERAMSDKRSAELASQAKSEFLSRMSHEIRTPLNAVRGFAQLLSQLIEPSANDLPAEMAGYVGHILRGSELLSDLVSDVLDLQQIEAGAMRLHCAALQPADLIEPCVAMFEPQARAAGITLTMALGYRGAAWGDRRRLSQVINNLVSNAIKYNKPGGEVRIITSATPNINGAPARWQLSVQDSGPGMTEAQIAKLFQPFERLGRDKSSIEGTGLGLIITKSLVEAMGGSLDISSEPGHGTRVTVTLDQTATGGDEALLSSAQAEQIPLAAADVAATPSTESTTPNPSANASPLRVMYVEDNRINALLFEEALRPFPELQLEVAEDGQVALTVARECRPEVLVIDAHLPGMTGFEVLQALRRLPGIEEVPAYMCSADAMPEDIAKAINAGFAGYWTKPIDIEQVTSDLVKLARQAR